MAAVKMNTLKKIKPIKLNTAYQSPVEKPWITANAVTKPIKKVNARTSMMITVK